MVPKRKQIRAALAQLDLWVNRSSLLLARMKMTFANGDTKTMAFEDVVPNATLEPGSFTWNAEGHETKSVVAELPRHQGRQGSPHALRASVPWRGIAALNDTAPG
jgi:hypothetical protein